MYQVSGKVLYKDGSVPKAPITLVRFEPTPNSTAEIRKAATGEIGPDGSFTLNTRKPGDGVYAGEYHVAFTLCKSATDTKPMIPNKYAYANQSPYTITVDGDKTGLSYEIEPLPATAGESAPAGAGSGT